jgi:homoserine O-acetyltransferase
LENVVDRAQGVCELGDFDAQKGGVIRQARLAWKTYGTFDADRPNAVLYPCSFTATDSDIDWLIGPGRVLDTNRWFVVIPNMFSNTLSSGASEQDDFPPVVTVYDNVVAQRRMLEEQFGISRLHAVYGYSMGGMQAYQWATSFRSSVDKVISVCSAARTSTHNRVFLSSLLRTLEAAPEYLGSGRFSEKPVAALRAVGHIYAAWGLSQDFYREGLHESVLGAADLESFLVRDWEAAFGKHDAANLYAQLQTWLQADVSDTDEFGGELSAALAAIEADVLLLPGRTDLYFRVEDSELELAHLRHGSLRVLESIWGHQAGNPRDWQPDEDVLRALVWDHLASPA